MPGTSIVAAYKVGRAPCHGGMPTSRWPYFPIVFLGQLAELDVMCVDVVPGCAPVTRNVEPTAVSRRCSSARKSRLASFEAPYAANGR